MKKINPFHLALPVPNLKKAEEFYCHLLGLPKGRQSETWIDINFFGHQLVFHQGHAPTPISNEVDKKAIHVPHFGVVLDWADWEALRDKLIKLQIDFIVPPYIRFKGEAGEQATLFFLDPNGLALEFKSFRNLDQLFDC